METALASRDLTTARETLFAKGAAHDENVLILVHDPAGDHLAILEGEQGHAIAFLDLLARSEENLYEVVGGGLLRFVPVSEEERIAAAAEAEILSKNVFEGPATVSIGFALNAQRLQLGQPEIGERSASLAVDVATQIKRAASATGDDQRQVVVLMGGTVAHSGSKGEDGVVQ